MERASTLGERVAVLDIGLLEPADWRVLRATRLRALYDSPHAFTSRYLVELDWDEHQWRELLAAGTWVVATDQRRVIGIAALIGESPAHGVGHVESVWVAPGHRQRGVLRSLLAAVAASAREIGLSALLLWVLEDNVAARDAYARLGFVPTGERQPIGPRPARHEVRLRLDI